MFSLEYAIVHACNYTKRLYFYFNASTFASVVRQVFPSAAARSRHRENAWKIYKNPGPSGKFTNFPWLSRANIFSPDFPGFPGCVATLLTYPSGLYDNPYQMQRLVMLENNRWKILNRWKIQCWKLLVLEEFFRNVFLETEEANVFVLGGEFSGFYHKNFSLNWKYGQLSLNLNQNPKFLITKIGKSLNTEFENSGKETHLYVNA